MPALRSLLQLSLAAGAAADSSGLGLGDALAYMPSMSWLNGLQMQMPFGQDVLGQLGQFGAGAPDNSDKYDHIEFTPLSAFPSNLSGDDSIHKWTYMPECLKVPEMDEPVCVFALQSFANGRGIAIVATPSNGTEFINSPIFAGDVVPPEANIERLAVMQEVNVPGAGRGMFAKSRLFAGDALYSYTPTLLLTPDTEALGDDKRIALYRRAVRSLPPASQRVFWDLGTHQDGNPEVDPVQDRVDTNAFGFDLCGVNYFVISPEIARLNHDCRPNAVYFLNAATMTQYVHIVRDVPPGEQLTVTYIDASVSQADRQAKLLNTWGFSCSCSLCTQHPRLIQESDERLKLIDEYTDLLQEDGEDKTKLLDASHAIEVSEALLALYETERHWAAMSEALTQVALAHSSAGHQYLAQSWAKKALKAALIEDGLYEKTLSGLTQLATHPKDHWSWNMRADIGRAKK